MTVKPNSKHCTQGTKSRDRFFTELNDAFSETPEVSKTLIVEGLFISRFRLESMIFDMCVKDGGLTRSYGGY